MTIGERVLSARKSANISQQKLADMVGITQPTLQSIEKNHTRKSSALPEIASALGVSYDWLLNGKNKEVNLKTLGEKIYLARNQMGLTQKELAEKVNLSQQAIQMIESGHVLKPKNLYEISKILNVSYEWLVSNSDHLPKLDTIAERFKFARKQSKISDRDLANMLGVTFQAINHAETGRTKHPKFLARAASIFDVPYEWLYTGEETPTTARWVDDTPPAQSSPQAQMSPIYGFVSATNESITINDDAILGYKPRYGKMQNDAYFVMVSGDSMEPLLTSGVCLAISPQRPLVKGRKCIVCFNDGTAIIKEFVEKKETELLVKQYNPKKELKLKLDSIKHIHAVLYTEEK